MYAGMHAHAIRATTSDLDDKMDYWAEGAVDLRPHYMGGRDWVITLMHPHHAADLPEPAPGHGRDSRRGLGDVGSGMRVLTDEHETGEDGILRALAAQVGPVRVMVTGGPAVVAGTRRVPEHGAMIEDEHRTWALWVDPQGRPASMWLRRSESGAVEGVGIGFDDDRLFTVEDTSTPWPDSYDTDARSPLDPDDCPEPAEGQPEHLSWGELVSAPSRTDFRYRMLYADGRTQFLDYRPIMGPGDALLERDAMVGWRVVATWPASGPVAGSSEPAVPEAISGAAAAYNDAVAALHEVTRAPLSTTIGHLIRQGYLIPSKGPRTLHLQRLATGVAVLTETVGSEDPRDIDRFDLRAVTGSQEPKSWAYATKVLAAAIEVATGEQIKVTI